VDAIAVSSVHQHDECLAFRTARGKRSGIKPSKGVDSRGNNTGPGNVRVPVPIVASQCPADAFSPGDVALAKHRRLENGHSVGSGSQERTARNLAKATRSTNVLIVVAQEATIVTTVQCPGIEAR
jgi:hypothetical protein